jgi:hypothetical protein
MPMFYQNYLAMKNTAEGTGGITVWSQSISGESAVNPLVAFYDFFYTCKLSTFN